MHVIYARQPLPQPNAQGIVPKSLFLAGPTPRSADVPSWRPEALQILANIHFNGTVFVPEDPEWGLSNVVYEEQTRWEVSGLGRSALILFWLARQLPDMPAFTTNTEYGFCLALAPQRLILGVPDEAVKVKYQKQLAAEVKHLHAAFNSPLELPDEIPTYTSLEGLLYRAAFSFDE